MRRVQLKDHASLMKLLNGVGDGDDEGDSEEDGGQDEDDMDEGGDGYQGPSTRDGNVEEGDVEMEDA